MSKREKSESMSSFEHVQLEEVELADSPEQNPSPTAAAVQEPGPAKASSSEAAPSQAAAKPAAAEAAPPPTAAAAAAQPKTPASPPATQALASVLDFFSGGGSSSGQQEGKPEGAAAAAAAGAAAEGSGGTPWGGEGQEEDEVDAVAAFEHEALEAADKVAQAAEEVGQKLLHGAAEAKESLASLAQGITSWWANLDPVKQPADSSSGAGAGGSKAGGSSSRSAAAAEEALGLEAGETVLESFSCQLWQTYTATNNFFTPVRQVPFPGSLHVTSQRVCFAFEDRGVAPIKLLGKAIRGVTKLAVDKQQGLPERIEVGLEGKQSLVVADFELGAVEADSALALLEHLSEQG